MGWTAQISLTCDESDGALAGAQLIFDVFTKDREAFIRATPAVFSDKDFDTQAVKHRGVVRFSFLESNGPHHLRESPKQISLAGMASAV